MFKSTLKILGASVALAIGSATAAPIVVNGDFVQLKINDNGTIGDGNTKPALVYDPSGTATFDPNTDYVAPGVPFEAFGFRSTETGLLGNNNASGNSFTGTLVDLSGGTFDNHLRWEGGDNNVSITHDFFFNDDDERVNIRTVLTGLTDLTGVSFARAVDPDPDNYPGGSAVTQNQRGIDANNDGDYDDPGDVKQQDFVTSVGTISGRPLGLYSDSSVAHDTGIDINCCSVFDPLAYVGGGDYPNGSTNDDGLGLMFDIGTLNSGQSITLDYAYVMGLSLATVDIPTTDTSAVPVPAPLALIGAGLMGLIMRRRVS